MARRSKFQSPWHNCTRCGIKTHLDDMKKERGILVCNRASCDDTELLGARDIRRARAIAQGSELKEMQPHPLLTETPVSDEDVFF
jgi:hypothetical protein